MAFLQVQVCNLKKKADNAAKVSIVAAEGDTEIKKTERERPIASTATTKVHYTIGQRTTLSSRQISKGNAIALSI